MSGLMVTFWTSQERTLTQSAALPATIDELPVRIFDVADELHGKFDFK